MSYTATVLTVSDKASVGERVDTAGPAVVRLLEAAGYTVIRTAVVPDGLDSVSAALCDCADNFHAVLILTVGGTGFSPRDLTPEATKLVIEREVPGIPEAMRAASMRITPRGCLSRGVAGIRGSSLIVNLPGSEKAATENLSAVLDPLAHGLAMLASPGSADCAAPLSAPSSCHPERSEAESKDLLRCTPTSAAPVGSDAHIAPPKTAAPMECAAPVGALTERPPIPSAPSSCHPERSAAESKDLMHCTPTCAVPVGAIVKSPADPIAALRQQERSLPLEGKVAAQPTDEVSPAPSLDAWLAEAKRAPDSGKVGMYLFHSGVVRETPRAQVREGKQNAPAVKGMRLSYDPDQLAAALEQTKRLPGIAYARAWLNEGVLNVGAPIMLVLVGGDIRPHVVDALQFLVGKLKTLCVKEEEF